MALVVFLRGVNVGGHRVFRPAALPALLPELGLVNVGAAGTFVVRNRVSRAELRRSLDRVLPFSAEIVVCKGTQIQALVASYVYAGTRLRPGMVRFVTVLGRSPTVAPLLPVEIPPGRGWLVKLISRTDRFVAGVYRRDMRTIGHLRRVDRLFDVPVTTRTWRTFLTIAKILDARQR